MGGGIDNLDLSHQHELLMCNLVSSPALTDLLTFTHSHIHSVSDKVSGVSEQVSILYVEFLASNLNRRNKSDFP